MPWMVISLINPEPALRGALSRFFVEIPVLTFAGKVDCRHADMLLKKVRATKGKAAIITARNNDAGFDIELIHHDEFCVTDYDGLNLISVKRSSIYPSVSLKGSKKPL